MNLGLQVPMTRYGEKPQLRNTARSTDRVAQHYQIAEDAEFLIDVHIAEAKPNATRPILQ